VTDSRTLLDRLMPLVKPTLVGDFAPPPRQVDAHLWVLDRRFRMPGGPMLPTRTAIVITPTGELVVVPRRRSRPSAPGIRGA
jgi:hypothetical protein